MRKRIPFLVCLIIGIGIIIGSIYLYFFTERTIYSSTETAIDTPSTSVTRTITLKENDSPHNIYLEIKYATGNSQNNIRLFSYNTVLADERGDIVEKKSSYFSHIDDRTKNSQKPNTDNKSTINLFKLKTIPSGNYALTLEIIPEKNINDPVKLNSFSYSVKSEAVDINPILPLAGIVVVIISIYLLIRKSKSVLNS